MSRLSTSQVVGAFAFFAALTTAQPAIAGPPLLCHPFDIGNARSLPWDGSRSWADGRADYDISRLVADTEAILTPSTPVIVRMETLRRAAIYSVRDPLVMKELFTKLVHKAESSERAGRMDALRFLDAAYVAGALRQLRVTGRGDAVAIDAVIGTTNAYGLVEKAVSARPDDAAMQFAAAMIAADVNRAASEEHARRARSGIGRDELLARNIRALS